MQSVHALPRPRHDAETARHARVLRFPRRRGASGDGPSADHDLVADLYREYGRTTFGYLVNVLGDRATAEDVQQEVFLEAWRRADSYDATRGSRLAWLMTITRSRAIDHLRKRVPEPRDPAGVAVAIDAADPAADADALVERWRLAHMVSLLPEEEALVLRMRFHDGLSQSEIAEASGIALGTVKMRMVQGLARLREMIEAEERS